jgi:flagellar export protein FliJ
MSNRQKRIALLTEHRKKELDDSSAELAKQRRALDLASQRLREAEHAELQAHDDRKAAAQHGIASHEWVDLNAWCERARRAVKQAQQDELTAQHEVETAQRAVLAARARVKQVEALAERLQRRHALEEQRAEQRANDERSASLVARNGGAF